MANNSPSTLIQFQAPVAMGGALSMLAKQKGVSRAWLCRAIMAEYLERKFGPNLRDAIAKWNRFGSDIMETFIAQALPAEARPKRTERVYPRDVGSDVSLAMTTGLDPMNDRRYLVRAEDPEDPLAIVAKEETPYRARLLEAAAEDMISEGGPVVPPASPHDSSFDRIIEPIEDREMVAEKGLEGPLEPVDPRSGVTDEHFKMRFSWEKK